MGSNSPPAGCDSLATFFFFRSGAPPPKPWERAGGSSGPAPFKPPSSGSTSDIVEASGTAKPGEVVPTIDRNVTTTNSTLTRSVPARPWQNYGANYGGYGSSIYNSSYGSNMYSPYGGLGSNGSLYGNNMYSSYGGLSGGLGMYGGGMYNSGFGGPMGGYGMGMGGPYGNQDPNNPFGPPPSPPSFWMSFLRVMQGVVSLFGRIAILIDQNTQAFHLFMTALLQLFDRSGMLYGELARFVFRILGIRTKSQKQKQLGQGELLAPTGQNFLEGPKASGSWDNVWADNKKGFS
ncbi:peroxisomal membrane protein 13-like isoform X2 [Curcuma longa]|uniref:peroxisomal membrane protein 13-like isoform X2 n=1 Tax=Curcuma longa TaxID=136217 RepID=UPI003D9E67F5